MELEIVLHRRTVVPLNPLLVTFPPFLTSFSLSVHWPNIPLSPVLPRFCVSLLVLHYLVPGFSGRRLVRTVSTSPLQLFHCCPLVLETLPSSPGHSPIGTEGVTFLALPVFPVSLLSSLGAVVLRLFGSLSCFVGASVSPFCLGLLSPFSCFCPVTGPGCLFPFSPSGLCSLFVSCPLRVLCLVFLAADWSGFPAPPSLPPFFPPALSLPCLACSSQHWLQCGTSGRRLVRGITSLVLIPTFPPFLTKHCLWPQTGPGLLLLNTDSWNSSLDSKQNRHGLNLTLMHSSMTYWKHWACIKIFQPSMA